MLAVDDDPQALRYLRDTLAETGYAVSVTGEPEEALWLVERERPHLVPLDLVQSILSIANVPVIFLSGYRRDQVIARAFELGAEDYIVKPFSPTELVARIQTAQRRRVAGREVQLTAIQYDLLQRVWGPANPGSPRVIRTRLLRLRRYLGEQAENPRYIFAEPRVGYRIAAADTSGEDK